MPKAPARRTGGPAIARNFSAEDMKRILHLIRNSKSVEIKVSVPMKAHFGIAKTFGFDPVEAEPRQVYFFDTADQTLNRAGVIVRARRRQGGRGDTVIKLRPVDPETIDAKLMRSEDFKVEVDAMPDGTFVCSASYKGASTGQEVRDVAEGRKPIRSLFSKEQLAFYQAHAPKSLNLDRLLIQGPILLLRTKHQAKEYPRGITVEMWLWPDGKHILEISTKSVPAEAFQAAMEFRHYLESHGIDLSAPQETKTRTAMDKFRTGATARRRNGRPRRSVRQRA
jgi:hypothetical protein